MFNNKAEELRNKANMIEALGDIYKTIEDKMKWDCMEYHSADEEHEESWFTPYDEDLMSDWQKAKLEAFKMVLDSIVKMAK